MQSRRIRGEQLIAIGRLLLAAFSALALWIDPLQQIPGVETTVLVFGFYSILLLALLLNVQVVSPRVRLLLHVGDLIFFTVLVTATRGAASLFSLFFVFSIICATLRFGSRGTLVTAFVAIVVYAAISLFDGMEGDLPFELNRFLVRSAGLAVMGALLVFLARYQERLQGEMARLALWRVRADEDLRTTLQGALAAAAETLGHGRVLLAWEELEEPWLHLASWNGGELQLYRFPPDRYLPLVAEELGDADFIVHRSKAGRHTLTLNMNGVMRNWSGAALGADFERDFGGGPLLSMGLRGSTFEGRLFSFAGRELGIDDLLLGSIVATLVRSAIDECQLLTEARTSAVVRDRGGVARDLHDGLLQSLTALRFQLEALDHQLVDDVSARSALEQIRGAIEDDQRELRRYVQQLRAGFESRTGSRRLEERFADLGRQMRRRWGIDVSFTVDATAGVFGEELLHDVYSIVHEAVANTARHGGSSNISVEIRRDGETAVVRVANDGHGFPFHGRYSLRELLALKRGPVSLKERIALLGGDMMLDSRHDGSELVMTIPAGPKANA